ACRTTDDDLIIELFVQQGLPDRRVDADAPLRHLDLVRTDQLVAARATILIFIGYPAAKGNRARVGGRGRHPERLESAAQVLKLAIDLPQPFLAVDIFGIF